MTAFSLVQLAVFAYLCGVHRDTWVVVAQGILTALLIMHFKYRYKLRWW